MINKESILKQIELVEYNLRRLKTIVECDMVNIPDTKVAEYCCLNVINQTENIQREITEGNNKLNAPNLPVDRNTNGMDIV